MRDDNDNTPRKVEEEKHAEEKMLNRISFRKYHTDYIQKNLNCEHRATKQ